MSCDENVRRFFQQGPALVHQRVAGADGGSKRRHQQPTLPCQGLNLAERHLEIFLDVVAECLERRDVENLCTILEPPVERFAHQPVDAGQERRQGFPRAGGRRDQRVFPGQDGRPAFDLGFRRPAELRQKPVADERMRPGQVSGGVFHQGALQQNSHHSILSRPTSFANCSPDRLLKNRFGLM